MKINPIIFRNSKGLVFLLAFLIFFIIIRWYLSLDHPEKLAEQPVALVQVTQASEKKQSKVLVVYGTVGFPPDKIEQVNLQSEAFINQVFVTQGQRVAKGQPLFKLSTTANSELNLKNAQISVEFAKKEVERLKKQRSQYLATNADVQTALQNLEKAEVALKAIQSQQKSEADQIYRAPVECSIISINVQPGQVVSPATSVLTYNKGKDVQIRLGVESEDLSKVKTNQKVTIIPSDGSQSYTSFVSDITNQLDSKTGLVDVIINLENAESLISGNTVKGEISIEPEKNTVVIPCSAVLYKNNRHYLFVDHEGKAERREVDVGDCDGKTIAIFKGLKAHESVIILGNYELEDGMPIRTELPG